MNQRLVKFAVELQTGNVCDNSVKYIHFNNSGIKKIFSVLKFAKETIPVDKNN